MAKRAFWPRPNGSMVHGDQPAGDPTVDGGKEERDGSSRGPCWSPLPVIRAFGYALFVGLMAPGYYYNVTFIQLGLHDLGTRIVGMSERDVAASMGLLALVTATAAIAAGIGMWRRPLGLHGKLRVASAAVATHAGLAAVATSVSDPSTFLAWIIVAALALGIGVPVTFGLAVDLVPVRHRGAVAAAITAAAYFAAAALAPEWRIEAFAAQLAVPMVLGAAAFAGLAWIGNPIVGALSRQHERPEFAIGRFASGATPPWRLLLAFIAALSAIFFIDSLGFLRLIFTPAIVADTWRSTDPGVGLFIGGVHVVGAVIGGILYARLDARTLLLWIFGIFALVQLMYVMTVQMPGSGTTLTPAMLYALAVSLYTVLTFAIWADLSTPRTIGLNVALGVGVAGWLSTFASTALSLELRISGVGVGEHLNWVAAIALVAVVVVLALLYFEPSRAEEPRA
jgi:hypothetical protein